MAGLAGSDCVRQSPPARAPRSVELAAGVQARRVRPRRRDHRQRAGHERNGRAGGEAALRGWLSTHGQHLSAWGAGAAKGGDDLLTELKQGESTLSIEFGVVTRCLRVAKLRITRPGSDQYLIEAKLKKGKNAILVKLCQNEQEQSWTKQWQFQLRVTDDSGTALLAANRLPTPQGKPKK